MDNVPKKKTKTKIKRKEVENAFAIYCHMAAHLKIWFMVFGIGGIFLSLKEKPVLQDFPTIMVFLLLGFLFQIALALINKMTQWAIYADLNPKEVKDPIIDLFRTGATNSYWIDLILDIFTFIVFLTAAALYLTNIF